MNPAPAASPVGWFQAKRRWHARSACDNWRNHSPVRNVVRIIDSATRRPREILPRAAIDLYSDDPSDRHRSGRGFPCAPRLSDPAGQQRDARLRKRAVDRSCERRALPNAPTTRCNARDGCQHSREVALRSQTVGSMQRFAPAPAQASKDAGFTRRTDLHAPGPPVNIRTRAATSGRAPPPARLRCRRSLPNRYRPHTRRLRRPDTALRHSRSGNRPCAGSGSATTCASPRR